MTDHAGRFSIWLQPGTHRLTFKAPGAADGAIMSVEVDVTRDPDAVRRFVIARPR